MSGLLEAARRHLPHDVHVRASRAALLRAAGYREGEIADALGVSVRTLERDVAAMQRAIVEGLRHDGYSIREAALTLGVDETHVALAA